MTEDKSSHWREEREKDERDLLELLGSVVGSDRAGGQMQDLAAEIVEATREIDTEDKAGVVVRGLAFLGAVQECTNPLCAYHPDNRAEEIARSIRGGQRPAALTELWRRKDIQAAFAQGEKYPNGVIVEQDELSNLVFSYVKRRWANCVQLERLMLDALVYAEVDGFGRYVKDEKIGFPTEPRKLFLRVLRRWLWLAMVAGVCGFGIGDGYGFWPGAMTTVIVYYLMVIAYAVSEWHEIEVRFRTMRLLNDMQAFYKGIAESNVSPTWLWQQLTHLSNSGAVWKAGTGALIQHAMRRNPLSWEKP